MERISRLSTRSFSIVETTPGQSRSGQTHLPVVINVYDLRSMRRCNMCMHPCGIGLYHTAIQVGKREITYGGNTTSAMSGIYTNAAQRNQNFAFKFSIPVYYEREPEVSVLVKTEEQIFFELLPRMGQRYTANTYDILLKNCNHFCEEFLTEITGGRFGLPGYINRAARIGAYFHCLVP